jgi:1,4-dihydroxy-2-naphthoate octaprenyltransferase
VAANNAGAAAARPHETEDPMIAFFLFLVIVAIVLGIIGVVAKGLLFLLIIGIVVFLGALVFAGLRMRGRPGRKSVR